MDRNQPRRLAESSAEGERTWMPAVRPAWGTAKASRSVTAAAAESQNPSRLPGSNRSTRSKTAHLSRQSCPVRAGLGLIGKSARR